MRMTPEREWSIMNSSLSDEWTQMNQKPTSTLTISKKDILKEESFLSGLLKTKVEVSDNRHYIKINFKSQEDKDRIIDIIKSSKKWNKNLCNRFQLRIKFIYSIAYEK